VFLSEPLNNIAFCFGPNIYRSSVFVLFMPNAVILMLKFTLFQAVQFVIRIVGCA